MWPLDQRLRYHQELLRKAQNDLHHYPINPVQLGQHLSLQEAGKPETTCLRTQTTQLPAASVLALTLALRPQAIVNESFRPGSDGLSRLLHTRQRLQLRQQQEQMMLNLQLESQKLGGPLPLALKWRTFTSTLKHHTTSPFPPLEEEPLTTTLPVSKHDVSELSPSPAEEKNEPKKATSDLQESPAQEDAIEKERKQAKASRLKIKSIKNSKWLASLEELKKYEEENGNCIVPRGYAANPKLASWVAEQRKQFTLLKDGKQSSITSERQALLNELDFAWNAQEAAWARHMEDLQTFRKETGHCHVPRNHTKYPKLGVWIKEQRRHYTLLKQGKQSRITKERAEKLDAVAFCWDTHEAIWLDRLRDVQDFKEKHGNCLVPTSYKENPKLGTWVHHQRGQFKKYTEGKSCHITEERIQALDNLGFVWYPRDPAQSLRPSSEHSSSSDSDTGVGNLNSRRRKRLRSS
jgi:hypothetical protein